jgi:hypothetical protein
MTTFQAFVISVLSGGFALGPWLFTAFEYVTFLKQRPPAQKRMLVAVFAGVISLSLWGLAIYLGYMPAPADRAGFAEAIWSNGILSGLSAFTSCTLLHTVKLIQPTASPVGVVFPTTPTTILDVMQTTLPATPGEPVAPVASAPSA